MRKKAFFLRFLDFPGALQALRKRAKKAEKGQKRPISGKGGQTPLKPPFVTPPFAATQDTVRQGVSDTAAPKFPGESSPLKSRGCGLTGWGKVVAPEALIRKALHGAPQ